LAQGSQQLGDSTRGPKPGESKLSGKLIIGELLRNMELGRFEMSYTVLLPCVFTIYLNPEDHASLKGVFGLIIEDARRSLRARVTQLNSKPAKFGVRRPGAAAKEHKIACHDWLIEFFPDTEVPSGDVEIHSELNEAPEPGYRGTKTTLLNREPTAASQRPTASIHASGIQPPCRPDQPVYAELRYEDDSGPQVYLVTQNLVRIGRGGDDQRMDLVLYSNDEVSREHLQVRRDGATGAFFIKDNSTNGTWVNGKRLRRGAEEVLPNKAEIGIGEVLKLAFEVRK
jgi:pSer/pThr/pTyr-binding forkhead associated (FHA) protein